MVTAPARFARDTTQGACAGMLTLAGATQLTASGFASDLALASGVPSLDTLGMQLVMGNFTGVLQILGAAALFLSAGRGLGRVLGLLVFVGAATAYFNGVAPGDILERSRDIVQALGPAYQTFQDSLTNS